MNKSISKHKSIMEWGVAGASLTQEVVGAAFLREAVVASMQVTAG
jgi:hypothetical protein